MLDIQLRTYSSLSRLQKRRNASPGSFLCQRDNCGRREYRQFSAPIACAVNSFVTTCSLFPLIPVVSTVFSNPEQLKAAPCFSACNCSSELEPGQSCGTLTSVVIYKPASLIIYLDRSDRLMWNSPRLPLHFTTKNAGRHEKELSPLCHAEADASERRLKCRKYQDFMVS